MDHILEVGDVVTLKVACLGNEPGTKGVVYEIYNLGYGDSASIIFENGEYDGFGPDEQDDIFDFVGHCDGLQHYVFTNVFKLGMDFEEGIFTQAFKGGV